MMEDVETVLRRSFEALNGCILSLVFPEHLLPPDCDPCPEHADKNNNSDDDRNNDDDDDYRQNSVINNSSNSNDSSTTCSTLHGAVNYRSTVQSSVPPSSRLGGESEGLAEPTEPDCTICYRKFGSVDNDQWFTEYGILYSCQHSFCRCCIQRWLRQFAFESRKCPVCRSQTVFCVSSPRWLPHHSPEKDSLLCCSPRWSMVQQVVRRCLASLRDMASMHLKLSCEAIRNMVAELVFDQEGLYHRHEITSII